MSLMCVLSVRNILEARYTLVCGFPKAKQNQLDPPHSQSYTLRGRESQGFPVHVEKRREEGREE